MNAFLIMLAKLAALIVFAVWVAVAILHYGSLPR